MGGFSVFVRNILFNCRIPSLFAAFAWREWKGGRSSLVCGAPTPQLMEGGEEKGGKGRFVILWRRGVKGTQGDKRFDRSFKR